MAGICRKLLTGSFALMLSAYVLGQGQMQAVAQTTVVSESSSLSSTSTSGDEVIKGYAFKYKERFRNYAEQIDNGQAKGWLSAQKAGEFKDRLEQLKTQEASAQKGGYSKSDVDALDQAVTKFNMDLTNAQQK